MRVFLVMLLAITLLSCHKFTPAGFWTGFQRQYLNEQESKQGPRGGHLAYNWEAEKSATFKVGKLLEFCRKNDWKLVDSSRIVENEMNDWIRNGRTIFPFYESGYSMKDTNDRSPVIFEFPRWIHEDLRIYSFKTDWVLFEPGTDERINVNGFVLINDQGTKMSVYHLWGE